MRPLPIRPATADTTPVALRGRASLRAVCATALAAALGFAPAIMVASPAAAAIPNFSFVSSTVSASEGGKLTFSVKSGSTPITEPQTISWSVAGSGENPATADEDFTDASGDVEFTAANQTRQITVQGLNDTLDEEDETFTLTIAGAGGAEDTAVGTLKDDDATPTFKLSVSDPNVDEGAGTVEVIAELSAISGRDVTIPVSTTAGTAKSTGDDPDFDALEAGTEITIPAGELTSTNGPTIAIDNDELYEEHTQSFTVKGTGGGAGTNVAGTATTTVNIVDDEEQSKLSITGDSTVAEGSAKTLTVTMAPVSERPVTVRWDTADGVGKNTDVVPEDGETLGVAKGGADYTTGGGTLTFAAKADEKTISVKSTQDTLNELDPEYLHVTLSAPTVAMLDADATDSTLGITDNDSEPDVSLVTPKSITEGNTGTSKQTFTVKLSKASGRTVTVNYNVRKPTNLEDNTYAGTADVDFKAGTGKLTFAPGETTKTFTVDVIGDLIDEGTKETFTVALDASGAAVDSDAEATVVEVKDDDAAPTASIMPITMPEGNNGSVVLMTVKLSNPSNHAIDFDVASFVGPGGSTAVSGGTDPGESDYEEPNSSVSIPAGQLNGYIYFLVNGDDVFEGNETVKVSATATSGTKAYLGDKPNGDGDIVKTGVLTLTNDDKAPVLVVTPASGTEGSTVDVKGMVTGVAQDDTYFSVTYAGGSVGGSDPAEADDFTNPGASQVTVEPGDTMVDLPDVDLTDDKVGEPSETIVVAGTSLTGTVTSGAITIVDNDDYKPVTEVTLTAPPYRQGVGSIDLTGKAGASAAVELWAAPFSGGNLAKVATTTSDAQGNYTFTRNFTTMGYRFQTMSAGLKSPERKVWLRHDPVLVANSPGKGAVTMKVTGDPKLAGLTVIFQWLNPATKEWEKIDPSGKTSPSGLAIKNITGLKSGVEYALRGYVVGDESMGLQGGYTGTRRVTVR